MTVLNTSINQSASSVNFNLHNLFSCEANRFGCSQLMLPNMATAVFPKLKELDKKTFEGPKNISEEKWNGRVQFKKKGRFLNTLERDNAVPLLTTLLQTIHTTNSSHPVLKKIEKLNSIRINRKMNTYNKIIQ